MTTYIPTTERRRAGIEHLLADPVTATLGRFLARSLEQQTSDEQLPRPITKDSLRLRSRRKRPREHPRLDQKVIEHLAEYERVASDWDIKAARRAIQGCVEGRDPCGKLYCSACNAPIRHKLKLSMLSRTASYGHHNTRSVNLILQPIGIDDHCDRTNVAKEIRRSFDAEVRALKRACDKRCPGVKMLLRLDMKIMLREHVEPHHFTHGIVSSLLPDFGNYDAVVNPHIHGFAFFGPNVDQRVFEELIHRRYKITNQAQVGHLYANQTRDEAMENWASYVADFSPCYYDKVGKKRDGNESRLFSGPHLMIVDELQRVMTVNQMIATYGFRKRKVVCRRIMSEVNVLAKSM